MITYAKGKFMRVAPMKIRRVIDLIRGKDVPTSIVILTHLNKPTKEGVVKVLESAVSNAKQKGLREDQLYISKITADQGPHWKRYRAATFGRATPILKRTTHLTVELDLITV